MQRRKWVSDESYAEILALSQFLPGPASSQTAFALGWQRGGFAGAMLATLTFTLPSALAMILLARLAGTAPPDSGLAGGLVAGLKITAVAVVAHAVLGMSRSLAPTGIRAGIALAVLAMIALLPAGAGTQIAAILLGAVIGLVAIFLPGFLLMAGTMPFWAVLSRIGHARHAMAGANAAVVGILGHALYDPVFTAGIRDDGDLALAVALFLMLQLWKRPAWEAVIAGALGGMALSLLS